MINFQNSSKYYKWEDNTIRATRALWLYLTNHSKINLNNVDFFNTNREEIINNNLKQTARQRQTVEQYSHQLIGSSHLSWIDPDNSRQHEFIKNSLLENWNKLIQTNQIEKNIRPNFGTNIGTEFEILIANIDLLPIRTDIKKEVIIKIKNYWEETISADEIFDWYKNESKDKIEITWKWLVKNEPLITQNCIKPKNLTEIKIIFDKIKHGKISKQHYIKEISRKFTQWKYQNKAKKSKTPLYIEISKEAKNVLDAYSKNNEVSKGSIIEILILETLSRALDPSTITPTSEIESGRSKHEDPYK